MAIPRGALRVALVAFLLLLPTHTVRADIAATGTFDVGLSAPSASGIGFSGGIVFNGDDEPWTALGRSIEMDADVGDMSFAGTAVVETGQEGATFDLGAESVDDTDGFHFTAAGAGRCDNSGCVGGTATFAGRFVMIDDPEDVLPDGIYTFDGTAAIDFLGHGPGGAFAINAFPRIPTTVGTDEEVSTGAQTFFDTFLKTERNFVTTARFASVTGEGTTEFVAFSALPGDFPSGVNFNAMVALFVDVSTNAMVGTGVHLCLSYPDANNDDIVDGTVNNISESRLRLLHATAIGQPFTDVTVSVGDERVCGDADAVGPITIGVAPEGATTTTSTSSTTSSLAPGATTSTSTTGPSSSTTSTSSTSSSTLPSGATTTSTTRPSAASTTTTTVLSPGSTTTSTMPPVCATALDCLDVAIAGPLCPGESVNQRLATTILKKLTKAATALRAAHATTVTKKVAKLIGKAEKQLAKIEVKADAFASKPPGKAISSACRDRIRAAVGLVSQQIEANRI